MEFGKWRSERGGGGRGKKFTISSKGCGVDVDADPDEGETVSASSSDELPPYEALRASILCSVNGSNYGGASEKLFLNNAFFLCAPKTTLSK